MPSTKKSARAPRPPDAAQPAVNPFGALLAYLVGLLLVARLLTPTESAEEGRTLWIVQLWLAAALIWVWKSIRDGRLDLRWNRLDAAFWIIVAGHVVSAVGVLMEGGHKRAAINLAWEWVGLGVCFFLLRQTVRTRAMAQRLVTMMIALAVSLAGLGLWQHYVFYPTTQREYEQKKYEMQRLQVAAAPDSRAEAMQRVRTIREIRTWMIDNGVPQEPAALALWEARLRSSEPFGTFALANTFAGLLLVWLIVGTAFVHAAWKGGAGWKKIVPPALAMVLVAYCLILTKSRTAWVGLLSVLLVWGLFRLWRTRGVSRRWPAYAGGGVLLLAALLAAAAFSGGFDREVLTEWRLSLGYRMQYWSGAWNALMERPLLGTGPGNFRQHYLRHKLPESSEEIADPHNLLLDVWANGGLIALGGLVAFLALLFGCLRTCRAPDDSPFTAGGAERRDRLSGALTVGGGFGFAAVFLGSFLAGDGFDLRMIALLAGWIAALSLFGRISNDPAPSGVCLLAAAAALAVHLLGAGGIEMPAIVQTLLVLAAALNVDEEESVKPSEAHAGRPAAALLAGGLMVAAFIACFLSAVRPELNRRALVAQADASLGSSGSADRAARWYRDAAAADPFSPIPPLRLAGLYHNGWRALGGDSAGDFDRAAEFLKLAIELDPYNQLGHRRLGELYLEGFRQSGDDQKLTAAIQAFQQALDRYPHNAALRAELALALDEAGRADESNAEAEAALRQDAVNRRKGHRDKYLAPAVLEKLHELAGRPPRGQAGSNRN